MQAIAWLADEPAGRGMVLFPEHDGYSDSARRESCAEVRDVTVLERFRRRGVATAIMRFLEEAGREAGFSRSGLSVGLDADAAPARALYERLGYAFAHGPFVTSMLLEGDDGAVPVGAVLTYLTKPL